ncbi:MAG: hypothetical protein ACRDZ5_04505, partial [Acidimicrobiales bacterium]
LLGCALVAKRVAFGRLLVGMVAGIAIPCFIFFLSAPGSFFHDVVVAELGQSGARSGSLGSRFAEVFGLGAPIGLHSAGALAIALAVIVLAAIVLLGFLQRHLVSALDVFVLVTAVVLVLACLVPASLPHDYGYFVAGFLMIVLGNFAGNVMSLLSVVESRDTDVGGMLAGGAALVVVAGAIALIAVGAPKVTNYERGFFLRNGNNPSALVDAHVPKPACVISNDASVLVIANRILGQPSSCPAILDPDAMITAASLPKGATSDPGLVAKWEQYLGASNFVVISERGGAIPWNAALRGYFDNSFTRVAQGHRLAIFANKGNPLVLAASASAAG